MAAADYWLCDVCSRKTFYDADLHYDHTHPMRDDGRMLPVGAGDMAAICTECAKNHVVLVMRRSALTAPANT